MFEQVFKNIDNVLRVDGGGGGGEIVYTEQTSWILFLRYLDEIEKEKTDKAIYSDKEYQKIIDDKFSWSTWACPKNEKGELDHHIALTGDDLSEFVKNELFPYLASFKQKADNAQTLEYKIGEIFSEIKYRINSGYNLRDILNMADDLPFRTDKDKHELSHLYESKIKNMGNAGRAGGQYYTPRPLIRAMINLVDPKIGETIYDPAVGSAGFLCEAFDYLNTHMEKTTENQKILQEKTFYGKEKAPLAYIVGVMNMILHGIEAPNIIHTNTLGENIRDIQEKDRHDIILANPPFGGGERKEVQQNFDIKSGETAFLFMQHFIKSLKAGGRAAIVIKNTFCSNNDASDLRQYLLESCNLHTVLDMPAGTFRAGVKTVVLFFNKGEPTKSTWFYQMNPGRNMGKTNPLNDKDLAEFIELQKTKPETIKSWNLNIADVNEESFDLSVKNPNIPEEAPLRQPKQILDEMESLDSETTTILQSIKDLL